MKYKSFILAIIIGSLSLGIMGERIAYSAKRDREEDIGGRHGLPSDNGGASKHRGLAGGEVEKHRSSTFRIEKIREGWGAVGRFLKPFQFKGHVYDYVVLHAHKMHGVEVGKLYKGKTAIGQHAVITGILSGLDYPEATIENTLMIVYPYPNDE